MKLIVFFTICCLSLHSEGVCKKCCDRGFEYTEKECPLCEGYGTVSPAYYGKSAGVTRWTTTESFFGGVKIGEWNSEKKYKKYTFQKCPVCLNYRKPGFIRTAVQCTECEKDMKKINMQSYKNIIRMLSKENRKYFESEIYDSDIRFSKDSFFWTKLFVERKNWKLDSKNKQSILNQAILDHWDTESASYAREK